MRPWVCNDASGLGMMGSSNPSGVRHTFGACLDECSELKELGVAGREWDGGRGDRDGGCRGARISSRERALLGTGTPRWGEKPGAGKRVGDEFGGKDSEVDAGVGKVVACLDQIGGSTGDPGIGGSVTAWVRNADSGFRDESASTFGRLEVEVFRPLDLVKKPLDLVGGAEAIDATLPVDDSEDAADIFLARWLSQVMTTALRFVNRTDEKSIKT
jgi:hypothetical protein